VPAGLVTPFRLPNRLPAGRRLWRPRGALPLVGQAARIAVKPPKVLIAAAFTARTELERSTCRTGAQSLVCKPPNVPPIDKPNPIAHDLYRTGTRVVPVLPANKLKKPF